MKRKVSNRPFVGVGVFVIKDDKFLIGKRIGSLGSDTWCLPGGHIEYHESVFTCAEREVYEETGVRITNLQKAPYTEDFYEAEQKHYITLFVVSQWLSGEPRIMEPDKCTQLRWTTLTSLPKPLLLPLQTLLTTGFDPFTHK